MSISIIRTANEVPLSWLCVAIVGAVCVTNSLLSYSSHAISLSLARSRHLPSFATTAPLSAAMLLNETRRSSWLPGSKPSGVAARALDADATSATNDLDSISAVSKDYYIFGVYSNTIRSAMRKRENIEV